MNHSNISGPRYRPIYSSTELAANNQSDENGSPSKTQRTKRPACVSCRQAKLKCVGLLQGTSCSRCLRKSIKCQVDPQYKRVGQRTKLRELSDEVKHLKDLIAYDQTASVHRSQPPESGQRHGSQDEVMQRHWTQPDNSNWNVHDSEELDDSTFHQSLHPNQGHAERSIEYHEASNSPLEDCSIVTARELDGVHVDALQISKLFQIFYQHFHPQMPLVNTAISMDKYFDLSPLLFWTVLAIASRADEAESRLHLRLYKPLTSMLWTKVSTLPMSHFTIQAIVLLCTWPYSTASLVSDPISVLISLAKAGCMHLGLHRPEQMQDYHRVRFEVQREQIDEAVMLWTCSFIAAERVTSAEGQDPLFPTEDPVLVQASSSVNHYSLPAGMRQILKIHMIVHQLRIAIISHGTHASHSSPSRSLFPLLKATELQLDSLALDLTANLKGNINIELACARLQVCVLYLHEPLTSSARRPGLIRAFQAASELITLLQRASSRPAFCSASPRHFGQNLKLAALLLLKLRLSSFSSLLDADKVEGSYALAISVHQRMIVHEHDFQARAAMLLGDIWQIRLKDNDLLSRDPVLTLDSRGSASLLYESHWQWRDSYMARTNTGGLRGRPAGILPSIILHSPASQRDANSQHDANSRFSGDSPMAASTMSKRGQESMVPQPVTTSASSWLSATTPFAGQFGEQSQIGQDDLLDDPLNLMFAYLNPDEEAAQLFYPQWNS